MAKIRKQYKERYTVVLNTLIEDKRLSYKAVGLFVDLWHSPDNWDYYLSEVVNRHTDGKDKVKSGLAELEKYGYLKRSNKHRNENGTFDSYDWDLSETPEFNQSGLSAAGNHHVGKTAADNPPLQNTNPQSTKNNKVLKDNSSSRDLGIAENPYNVYQQMTGIALTDVQQPKMMNFINNDGSDLVVAALKTTKHIADRSSGKPNFNLFDSVIREWKDAGVDDVDTARKYEKKRLEDKERLKQQQRRSFNRQSHDDKRMPERMKEKYDPEKHKIDPEKKRRIEEQIKNLKNLGGVKSD